MNTMRPIHARLPQLVFMIGSLFFSLATVLAHEDDEAFEKEILVGRTAAGQLKVVLHFPQPVAIPKSIFRGITGYATATASFHSTIFDDVANDLYQLSPETNFRFVLLAKDPGMEVWDDTGSGYMNVGDTFYIGPSPFDTHPIWNIVAGTPGNSYSITVKVIDLSGIYPESTPFTLNFTPPRPYTIHIQPIDPQNITVSWPTNAVDWELQFATELSGINWNAVTNVPMVIGTNYSLNFSTSGEQFFRLRHVD